MQKYDPVDEEFDPHRHNAVFQVPDPSKPPNTVAVVLKVTFIYQFCPFHEFNMVSWTAGGEVWQFWSDLKNSQFRYRYECSFRQMNKLLSYGAWHHECI